MPSTAGRNDDTVIAYWANYAAHEDPHTGYVCVYLAVNGVKRGGGAGCVGP